MWIITSEAVSMDDSQLFTEVQVPHKVGCTNSEFCGLYKIMPSIKLIIECIPQTGYYSLRKNFSESSDFYLAI